MLKLPKPFRKQGQQLCSDGNTAVFFDAYNVDHMHDAYQQGLAEQPERVPLTMEQCKAKFEAWYASAPDEEPKPDRTYELSDESMSELTKGCIWLGWQAAYGIKQGGQHD